MKKLILLHMSSSYKVFEASWLRQFDNLPAAENKSSAIEIGSYLARP